MENDYNNIVSVICHVEAGKYVVSGSISGDVNVNNNYSGTRMRSINFSEYSNVRSFTRCPFNPNMFMVGNCRWESKLLIYDNRDHSNKGRFVLTVADPSSIIPSRYNNPAWDSETVLFFAPMRGHEDCINDAAIIIWDPRFVKYDNVHQIKISQTEWSFLSIAFAKTAAYRDRVMVTGSEDYTKLTIFSDKKNDN
ncbi:hypothetical protein LPJ73_002401 [Coemansia sp. RSA 2703]|nr:hypothetical protein LPJ73_002401 [Coemansia sp. RSA 2703]KAJ2375637.1 hypothetical protein IW150_002438 [Coemansia sp. RSA 2607]